MLSTGTKSIYTIINFPTRSTSVTPSVLGNGLIVLPASPGVAC